MSGRTKPMKYMTSTKTADCVLLPESLLKEKVLQRTIIEKLRICQKLNVLLSLKSELSATFKTDSFNWTLEQDIKV
jgi:hypothetical protein